MNSINVINLFGKALRGKEVSFEKIQKVAFQRGYLVHPDCCTNDVYRWLDRQPVDYNATFYKEWQVVEAKSRMEIWLDQVTNYIFNYGAGFTVSPNNGSDQPQWKDLKLIEPIDESEVIERAQNILYSPVPMKQDTIEMVLSCLDQSDIEVDLIKNKEARLIVCESKGLTPNDPVEMVRYLVYLTTGKSLLIKNSETIALIKNGSSRPDLGRVIESYGLEKLSSVFLRFKPLFLAMKTPRTSKLINRLRRLAKKNHKPMKEGFFPNLLSDPNLVSQLPNRLKECDNYTKVKLLMAINERQKDLDMRFFTVRNGKLWAKEGKSPNKRYYKTVFEMVYNSLVESLSKNATKFYIPNGVNYTVPTSEKMFVGNFPMGTSFEFGGKDAVIGIHRRKEMSRGFFDFSLNTSGGKKIGWNDKFNSDNIKFSGDICHNDCSKEAVELFYAKNGFDNNYITKVNNYDSWNSRDIEFNAFLAIEPIKRMKKNYMVDPNNIIFNIPLVCLKESKEMSFGVLTKDRFVLTELKTGNKAVAGKSITNLYADYAVETLDCYIDLKQLLMDSGYKYVEDVKQLEDGEDFIDLSVDNLSKDSIISLLG